MGSQPRRNLNLHQERRQQSGTATLRVLDVHTLVIRGQPLSGAESAKDMVHFTPRHTQKWPFNVDAINLEITTVVPQRNGARVGRPRM